MSPLSEHEAKAILDKTLKLSTADECVATLAGSVNGNIRYALNGVSTSGIVGNAELAVQVAFGKRVGTATINELDDASLEKVVRRAEGLARLAPENPEFVPALDKQLYPPSDTYIEASARITPAQRASIAADCIEPCRKEGLVAAGFFTDSTGFSAIANSKGNFGYQTSTNVDFTCTVRTGDGRGSGYVARNFGDVRRLDAKRDITTAMRKARDSADAKALEPGKYTVILEPEAVVPMMFWLVSGGFDAREADEGRSFLGRKGGGNKLGEKIFDERVTLYGDPRDADVPVLPWDDEGVPREKTPLVTNGRVEHLHYSRYWTKTKNRPSVGAPGNLVMAGGEKSIDEMIKSTRKGLLVTRTHYVNMVDPETMQLAGLTRDGTFYVENGEIKYPIRNFRFNESVVVMLNNVEEIGKAERTAFFFDVFGFPMMLPALKIRDFTFTSLSDAV